MSTSVGLGGAHRSAEAQARKNPFTGEVQMMHAHSILAEQQRAIEVVLARHPWRHVLGRHVDGGAGGDRPRLRARSVRDDLHQLIQAGFED